MNHRKALAFTAFPITLIFSLLLTFSLYIYSHRQAIFTEAAWDGNILRMKFMLAIGIKLDSPACPYRRCFPAIVGAAFGKRKDVAQFLIAQGADVNAKMGATTALMVASYYGDVEMVRLLISNGADVNASRDGETALMIAKEQGNSEVVEVIRRAGREISDKCHVDSFLRITRSNNSFNASGISSDVIDNLAVPQMIPAALIRALGCYFLSNSITLFVRPAYWFAHAYFTLPLIHCHRSDRFRTLFILR